MRDANLTSQHRYQYRPYRIEQQRLRFGGWMQTISLKIFALAGNRRQQEGHALRLIFKCKLFVQAMELFGIGGAVVGRQSHADEQDLYAAFPGAFYHGFEIGLRGFQ